MIRSLPKVVDAWKKSHFVAKATSLSLLHVLLLFAVVLAVLRAVAPYCVEPTFSLNALSVFLEPLMIILVVVTVLFYVFVMPLILNLIVTPNTINRLAISFLVAFINITFIIIFDVAILALKTPT